MSEITEPRTAPKKRPRRFPWRTILVVALLGGIGYAWWHHATHPANALTYELGALTRGNVSSHVLATGTLDAVTRTEVGSQVSGPIVNLYVDYNASVVRGQPLARIDPAPFQAAVDQARAAVNNAKANGANMQANVANQAANVRSTEANLQGFIAKLETARAGVENAAASEESARANLTKARSDLSLAATNYRRYQALLARDLVARSDRDTAYNQYLDARAAEAAARGAVAAAVATRRSSLAAVRSAATDVEATRMKVESAMALKRASEAQVRAAEAQVRQAQANLDSATVNLKYTVIRSPIKGVVLDRKISIGQTVAASFTAPDLFTLAENLDQMEVLTSVDEADIGRVRVHAHAVFSVDAFPNRKFEGEVSEIRQAPVTTNNVVTYTVVVTTRNPQHLLMPGMTATVSINVESKKQVVLVPNAALRYRPSNLPIGDHVKVHPSGSPGAAASPSPAPSPVEHFPHRHDVDTTVSHRPQRVWIVDPHNPKKAVARYLVLGITDGNNTEVVGAGGLKVGDKVIVGDSGSGKSGMRGGFF